MPGKSPQKPSRAKKPGAKTARAKVLSSKVVYECSLFRVTRDELIEPGAEVADLGFGGFDIGDLDQKSQVVLHEDEIGRGGRGARGEV